MADKFKIGARVKYKNGSAGIFDVTDVKDAVSRYVIESCLTGLLVGVSETELESVLPAHPNHK